MKSPNANDRFRPIAAHYFHSSSQRKLGSPFEKSIAREKAMKAWNREWKIELIEQANPDWLDLWEQINA